MRRISLSRPITGSILPSSARRVRLRAYLFRCFTFGSLSSDSCWRAEGCDGSLLMLPLRKADTASLTLRSSTPNPYVISRTGPGTMQNAQKTCSSATALQFLPSSCALTSTSTTFSESSIPPSPVCSTLESESDIVWQKATRSTSMRWRRKNTISLASWMIDTIST